MQCGSSVEITQPQLLVQVQCLAPGLNFTNSCVQDVQVAESCNNQVKTESVVADIPAEITRRVAQKRLHTAVLTIV